MGNMMRLRKKKKTLRNRNRFIMHITLRRRDCGLNAEVFSDFLNIISPECRITLLYAKTGLDRIYISHIWLSDSDEY